MGRIRSDKTKAILDAAEIIFAKHGFSGATMLHIAEQAQLPRPNVHYYFKNKTELYNALLQRVLTEWNQSFAEISEQDDPATALKAYIHAKVRLAKERPLASKIFATEIIQGAPHLDQYLASEHKAITDAKAKIIQSWVDSKKIDPIDPYKLIFLIWSSTQHYADFSSQVVSLLDKKQLDDDYYEQVANELSRIILKGCGLD